MKIIDVEANAMGECECDSERWLVSDYNPGVRTVAACVGRVSRERQSIDTSMNPRPHKSMRGGVLSQRQQGSPRALPIVMSYLELRVCEYV